jgi:hypothetical protein
MTEAILYRFEAGRRCGVGAGSSPKAGVDPTAPETLVEVNP